MYKILAGPLDQGADITRGTKHMKYTAKEWAEWSSASNVLQILEMREQANATRPDEHMFSGVWSPPDEQDATEDLDTSNALIQDVNDWCRHICLRFLFVLRLLRCEVCSSNGH